MAPDGQNFRAVNAIQLLSNADKITLDDLIKKGYDHYLAAFDVMFPSLFSAYAQAPDSLKQQLAEPVKILQQWDKRSAISSIATTLAVEWGTRMLTGLPRATNAEQATYQTERMKVLIKSTTPEQELKFLLEVLKSLEVRFGNWKIPWGDINRYQRSTDGKFHDDQPSIAVAQTSSAFGQLPSFVSNALNTKKR